ncbi:MAG: hypothetical protein AUI14_01135 [Actinobacteria bacterium 13_2_20CM_2_71_6]|nr:MAG: hypothetical protein AUI14_01135 [Actinobacteria bacterium 13_2_20CM_2_71_6]
MDWAAKNVSANDAWGYFLKTLAWPNWSFSSSESVRQLLADDIRAILLIVFAGVFVALLAGSQLARARASVSQFFAGWGGYIFAGTFAGFLVAFIGAHATLLGAFCRKGWRPWRYRSE